MTHNLLGEWAGLLLDSLAQAGVREVVISPGSRSTPFVYAADQHPLLTTTELIDERSAAFYALGQGRTTGRPSLLLCTSGTAGANYLPAVVEAKLSYTPLLVVTADRPLELSECAAPQTIDQIKLFGDHARAFFELGLPDASDGALRGLRRLAAQAVHTSRRPIPGAVHLNARARKPLEPILEAPEEPVAKALSERCAELKSRPPIQPLAPSSLPAAEAVEAIAQAILSIPRGLIVAGPAALWERPAGSDRGPFFHLAATAGYPLLVEGTSQLRFTSGDARGDRQDGATVIDALDLLAGSEAFRDRVSPPQLILQIGAPPTSGAWQKYLADAPDARRIVLAEHGWNDPESRAEILCFADPATAVTALGHRLEGEVKDGAPRQRYRTAFQRANEVAWKAVAAQVAKAEDQLTEGGIPRLVAEVLPGGSLLGVGNSLPVRQLDLYCPAGGKELAVWCQRGANGIDGIVSGFAGSAGLFGGDPISEPGAAALIVGDVSFLHDLGGLAAARSHHRRSRRPLVIVVVHNDGGRIFEQLPIARLPGLDEEALRPWLTPHGLELEPVVRMYGLEYARVETVGSLGTALRRAVRRSGCTVVEAVVPPHGALEQNQALRQRLDEELKRLPTAANETAKAEGTPSRLQYANSGTWILLHGFTGTPAAWQPVIDKLPLSAPAVALPLPGHSCEAPPPGDTFESAVDDLARRIRTLGRGPFRLAGYSLGGRLALGLLVRHPELFSEAALLGAHPGLESEGERRQRRESDERWAHKLEQEGLRPFLESWPTQPLFASQKNLPTVVRERQRRERLRHDCRALAWSSRTLSLGNMPCYLPRLEHLHHPVHLVVGELDEKFHRLAEVMAGRLPQSRLSVIARAGHNVILEAPRAVAALLLEGVEKR